MGAFRAAGEICGQEFFQRHGFLKIFVFGDVNDAKTACTEDTDNPLFLDHRVQRQGMLAMDFVHLVISGYLNQTIIIYSSLEVFLQIEDQSNLSDTASLRLNPFSDGY